MSVSLSDDDPKPPMSNDELAAYEEGRRMRREGRDFFDVTEMHPYRPRQDNSTKWAREQGWLDEDSGTRFEEIVEALRIGESYAAPDWRREVKG